MGKVEWENPLFKDSKTGESLPYFRIFGEKKKGKSKHAYVDKVMIEEILRKNVPYLR
jgi:hypothetical protein